MVGVCLYIGRSMFFCFVFGGMFGVMKGECGVVGGCELSGDGWGGRYGICLVHGFLGVVLGK